MDASEVQVLLVNGDQATARRVRDLLGATRDPPFRLHAAPTVAEALDRMVSDPFDAVILALSEDGEPGLRSYALLRTAAPAVPVLVLTPAALEGVGLKALQQGAADVIIAEQLHGTLLVRSVRCAMERRASAERERSARRALGASERRYRDLFENSRDGIVITDHQGVIVEANHAAAELAGLEPRDLTGTRLQDLWAESADLEMLEREMEARGGMRDMEVPLRGPDGRPRWCLLSVSERVDERGALAGYHAIVHDINARKEAEERLLHDAFHDPLTGLPNRALFMDRLEVALARAQRDGSRRCAVLFLDLDRFKVVNDSLGHAAGDELLVAIGEAIRSCLRREDTVARLGGDEFAVLINEVAADDDAVRTAERIRARLGQSFQVAGQRVFTGASIGVAFPESPDQEPADLVRNADIAMYRAKSAGLSSYVVFSPSMGATGNNRLRLETELRDALERGEFELHYHPILSLSGQSIVGVEALLRWRHPERGLMRPHAFLDVAEETGLIQPIGWWALGEACRRLRRMLERRPAGDELYMAVNFSGRQLAAPDFVERAARTIEEAGAPARLLTFEVSERALMANLPALSATIIALRELGIRVAIDDFGAGYSWLGYLHSFKVDGVKIDRALIQGLGASGERDDAVATMIGLANRLGLSAVAEGVETAEQLRKLEHLRPACVQGFLFSQPLEAAEIDALLARPLARR